ncbi:MAG: NAD-dependent epimerase/dehydratase family protein, partial [Planctomycetota bacterium]|nr:NAD-dependent epimerase/dehydratase family protein [Planctomycetota bacterium]
GGAGFIGSALARELVKGGREVLALDDLSAGSTARLAELDVELVVGDVADRRVLRDLLRRERPVETWVHLAGRVGVGLVLGDPDGCLEDGRAAQENLLAVLAKLPVERRPRVLAASSSEVYRDEGLPVAEDAPLRREAAGRWAYAAAKLAGEQMLDAERELWPAERAPVHLRFFNVVGPGQDSRWGMVLPNFVERALAGKSLLVHGGGEDLRTFAHVDSVARTLAALIAHPALPGGPLNIGSGNRGARCTIAHLAATVAELAGRSAGSPPAIEDSDPRNQWGPSFTSVRHREPDLSRLISLGVPAPDDELESIVADMLARHGALRAQVEAAPCASRAS